MYLDGRWYAIDLSAAAPRRRLARQRARRRAACSSTCSSRCCGIGDIRTDKRIDFVGGARGTAALEQAVDSRQGGGRVLDVSR